MSDPFDDIPFGDDDAPRPAPAASGIAARAMAARTGGTPAYLEGLNPEQRRAVETTEGPVLVLAGAGTGKTRVLTTRIAHILSQGLAWPSQILAVTFTNKAAREMKERIGLLVGEAVEGMPWLGTFHSIGVKILRRHAELAGLKSGFTILDTDDQIRLLKQVIQAEGLDDKRWAPRAFAQMIDGWKNKGYGPKDIPGGRCPRFRQRQGPRTVPCLSEPAEDAQRGGFRRSAVPADPHFPRQSGCARRISRPLQIHPRRRVPGHQHGAISVAAPDRAKGRNPAPTQRATAQP